MTRKKLKLAYIEKHATRKACMRKRRASLLKKVRELSILCGVETFAIVYCPDESQPVMWPSRPVVKQLLERLQGMPKTERCRKMITKENYLWERVSKVGEQCRKIQKKNREMEMGFLMSQIYQQGKRLDEFGFDELHGLVWMLHEKMEEIRRRVESLTRLPPVPADHLALQVPEMADMGRPGGGAGAGLGSPAEAMLWNPWQGKMMGNGPVGINRHSGLPSALVIGGAIMNGGGMDQRGLGAMGNALRLGLPYTEGSSVAGLIGLSLAHQGNIDGRTSGSDIRLAGIFGGRGSAGGT